MFRKISDEVILVYNPRTENVEVGQNISILDEGHQRGLIVQVIEQSLIDLAGILEDIIRTESIGEIQLEEYVAPEYEKYRLDVQNMKFARAKIRKEILVKENDQTIEDWTGWVPDRSAKVSNVEDEWLMKKLGIDPNRFKFPIEVGQTAYSENTLMLSAYHLQGINVIVGKKGSGKSHIAKCLLLGLIDHHAKGVVFDINDEYSRMRFNPDNSNSNYYDKIISLNPGENMRFTLPYIGADVFFDVIQTTMGLGEPSAYALRNKWVDLEDDGELSFANLQDKVANELDSRIKGAVKRRLQRMENTKIFTDRTEEGITLEDQLNSIEEGGMLVINLKMKDKDTVDLVVQTLLSKLQELLEKGQKPLFIFAEEAHMYLRETDWADAVTRMRHLGSYQLYMTNTPTQIRSLAIRQTDNLFLFHLTESGDFQHITPATRIDPETIEHVSKALPPRRCLVVGEVTNHYPWVIKTTPLSVKTAGETRQFFTEP